MNLPAPAAYLPVPPWCAPHEGFSEDDIRLMAVRNSRRPAGAGDRA